MGSRKKQIFTLPFFAVNLIPAVGAAKDTAALRETSPFPGCVSVKRSLGSLPNDLMIDRVTIPRGPFPKLLFWYSRKLFSIPSQFLFSNPRILSSITVSVKQLAIDLQIIKN